MTSRLSILRKLGILAATAATVSVSIAGAAHAGYCDKLNTSATSSSGDHPGGDFKEVVLDPYLYPYERCYYACTNDISCMAWTYVYSNSTCYLKNQVNPLVSHSGMYTGMPYLLNTNLNGGAELRQTSATAPGKCHQDCMGDDYCMSWTWVASNNTCYLKSNIPAATATSGMVSATYKWDCAH